MYGIIFAEFRLKRLQKNTKTAENATFSAVYLVRVFITDLIPSSRKNQIEAQRSGFDLERRSSGMSALCLLKKVGASDIELAPTWSE